MANPLTHSAAPDHRVEVSAWLDTEIDQAASEALFTAAVRMPAPSLAVAGTLREPELLRRVRMVRS